MSIDLFEHNQTAYESAVAMLAETGKAAVIHPTGTGKSFIGFKLCEDNPGKTVCWLSPSEYIFKTQLENLKKTGAEIPQNIKFFTYAKLTYMSDTELEEIAPDAVIIDEFHRAGACIWQKNLAKFLDMYRNVPVLGLSATNVRYLDNQRDMAEELFDGNIASEMTLGEAIVRGILKAPLYISTVFSYQKDLEKYERMAKMPKFKAVRDTAEKYLEELRRTIEKADGLDVIFEKYMPDKHGKYVVFCANREHLDEMISHVDEWFYKVDDSPKVYKVYSDNPESSGEFADFKLDKSDNLKLLFCIDMLNEGVHLDDIDGVILFRPTVSPTVYKQQIGRALTAGKSGTPVIFDVINNFENLYSMGAIEQEMACAISYYNSLGEGEKIAVEKFEIIGIVKDCVELFDKLNSTLTVGWDFMFSYAEKYYAANGNLEVPLDYKTEDGVSLGIWVRTQRNVRKGIVNGILTEERIRKLDSIGMQWDDLNDLFWQKNYNAAKAYFEHFGNLKVKPGYVTEDGLKLGMWIVRIRTYRKNNIRSKLLTDERINDLDKIGMIWDVPDYIFESHYSAALEYYKAHGDLEVPYRYVAPNNIRLGSWIKSLRGAGRKETLTESQIARLDEIKMRWGDKNSLVWGMGFVHAKGYAERFGDLDVPINYVCEDGYALGRWLLRQRSNAGIAEERREMLDSIGMVWVKSDQWCDHYETVRKYYEEHGNLDIPSRYNVGGFYPAHWLNDQKRIYRGEIKGRTLTEDKIKKLENLNINWNGRRESKWNENYELLKKYAVENGNLNVPANYVAENGIRLAKWLSGQNNCSGERKRLLSEIGVEF